jgi:hypothetical protein
MHHVTEEAAQLQEIHQHYCKDGLRAAQNKSLRSWRPITLTLLRERGFKGGGIFS